MIANDRRGRPGYSEVPEDLLGGGGSDAAGMRDLVIGGRPRGQRGVSKVITES